MCVCLITRLSAIEDDSIPYIFPVFKDVDQLTEHFKSYSWSQKDIACDRLVACHNVHLQAGNREVQIVRMWGINCNNTIRLIPDCAVNIFKMSSNKAMNMLQVWLTRGSSMNTWKFLWLKVRLGLFTIFHGRFLWRLARKFATTCSVFTTSKRNCVTLEFYYLTGWRASLGLRFLSSVT